MQSLNYVIRTGGISTLFCQEMKITPREKNTASIALLLGGAFILIAGSVPLCAPFLRGEYWLLIVCLPVTLITWWISRVLIGSYLNSAFSTTEVDLGGDCLTVRNRPFGRTFNIAYADIRTCQITDILSPKACLEILLTDRSHKTYQICAFRSISEPIESLQKAITTKAEQADDSN